MQGVPVSCQGDPHIGLDDANDPALMVICRVWAGHPGTISQGYRRIPVSVHRHQQVHKVGGSNPYSQDQQVVCNQIYQVNCLQVWGRK
jgi:hypothetical protein